MIMNHSHAYAAATFHANVDPELVQGFGKDEVAAMQRAIESGNVTWEWETAPTTWLDWSLITQDAKRAGILTFHQTPYGVLITDEN